MRRFLLGVLAWGLTLPVAAQPAKPAPERPFLVLDAGGHTAIIKKVLFVPSGKYVLTVSHDKTIRAWDVATGESIRTLRPPIGPGEEGLLQAASVSADGKRIAIGGVPYGGGKLGMLIHLISLETGRVETVLKGKLRVVSALSFSPGGSLLAAADTDGTIILFDVKTGQPARTFETAKGEVASLVFAPDGYRLLAAGEDGVARIWSLKTGKIEAELKGHTKAVVGVAWSPDGKTVATGGRDGTVRLWEPTGASRLTCDELGKAGEVVQVTSLRFNRDSKELLYTGIAGSGRTGIIDVSTGKTRLQFTKHTNTVMHGHLSPDGSLAVTTGGNDHDTYLWKTADGSVVHHLVGRGQTGWAVAWSGDGKSVAWGHTNRAAPGELHPLERTFHLTDLSFGSPPDDSYRTARKSRGPRALVAIDMYRVGILENGKATFAFRSPVENDRVYAYTMLGEDRAVIGTAAGLFLIDLANAKLVRTFRGHSGLVLAVAPSPDDKFFVSTSTDQTIRVWDPEREESLLSLFAAGGDWVVWTADGYYAASPGGEQLVGWHVNNGPDRMGTFYAAARFRRSLYYPDLVRLVLPTGSVPKALALANKDRKVPINAVTVEQVLPPVVAVTAPVGEGLIAVKETKLEVKATARSVGKFPVTSLRLLVDGRPFQGQAGLRKIAQPKLGDVQQTWTVELPPGKHTFAVIAESEVSKALSPVVQVFRGDPNAPDKAEPPNLYVLAIGVSSYPGPMKLRYAATDAQAISKTLKEKSELVFKKIEVKVMTDKEATRKGILEGLEWLGKRMTAQDVAVIFFSGHGTRDPAGDFYLVPVDADAKAGPESLFPGGQLKKALEDMPGRLIAVLDACHSGGLADGGARSGPGLVDDLVRDLAAEECGVIVMCSSLGKEFSIESSAVEHGYFTLALVEGLSGKADVNGDGLVHFSELDVYAAKRVKELSKGKQNPVTTRPPTIPSFPLAKP